MNKQRVLLIVGVGLIATGLFFAMPAYLRQKESMGTPKVAAATVFDNSTKRAPVEQSAESYVEGKPVRLQIPSLEIDLPIAGGVFNEKTREWTLSRDKVHYALSTPLPNNSHGNTFMYGHNRREVFRSLAKIKLNEQVLVTTDNGRTFVYTFIGSYETTPDDDTPFRYSGKPMLTVQTCSGAWYENRQLFMFDLKEIL
jgi:LPXTG-site transpeptidase (sortase) family protein